MLSRWLTILCLQLAWVSVASALEATCFTNANILLQTPQSSNWSSARAVFNAKIDVEPAAVVYAQSESQVQDTIKCARASNLQVVPRGGGHGYEGYAVQAGAVVLDVSSLTSFRVDSSNSSVTFGSGFRLGDLYLAMYMQANSLFPAGVCPWVGTSGHILGGGVGQSVRQYGLACDQLLGLTMVDYKGDIIEASKTENPDLLWASCGGGGGNLGIVTSFTVKTNSLDKVPVVTTASLNWPGYSSAAQIFDKAQRFFPTADRRLTTQLLLSFANTQANVQWLGDEPSARQQLQLSGLLDIPGLDMQIRQETWMNASVRWAALSMRTPNNSIFDLHTPNAPASEYFTAGSSYNQELMSAQGIDTMISTIANLTGGTKAFIGHEFMLGAVSDVKPSDTAYYHRDSLFETQWYNLWGLGDNSGLQTSKSWLSNALAAMQPYVGQGAYINYPDPNLAATTQWPQAYYGGNLDRYVDVKTKYDPTNFFHNPLTVQPRAAPGPQDQGVTSAGRRLLLD